MAKPVTLREHAAADLNDASEYYRTESGSQRALEFIGAVERAIRQIGRSPQIGSLRFAYELAIPELRAWSLQRFPYLVVYVVGNRETDVWRILHPRRGLPTLSDS